MDIHFFHFPKSEMIQSNVEDRIRHCVKKYHFNIVAMNVYFVEKSLADYEMKIEFHGADHFRGFVHATGKDPAHAFDKTIDKLESFLHKNASKKKHKKVEFSHVKENSNYNVSNLRYKKRKADQYTTENAFDKYEDSFINEFDESESVKKAS